MYDGFMIDFGHGGFNDTSPTGTRPHRFELGGEVFRGHYTTPARNGKRYTFTDVSPRQSVYEGIINRWLAAPLMAALVDHGAELHDCVGMRRWDEPPESWRDLEQRDTPLAERVAYANRHPDLPLISIHCNAQGMANVGSSQPKCFLTVYTHPGQTGSDALATAIFEPLDAALRGWVQVGRGDWSDGDVDHEANFYILTATRGEAVLIEGPHFDNFDGASFLASRNAPRIFKQGLLDALLPMLTPTRRRNRHRFRRADRAQS